MVRKRYKLFGITVWEIEADIDEPAAEDEDEEIVEKDITAAHTLSAGDTPMFGFTNFKEYTGDDDE